jgi:MSHA biogenesis protein MshP
MITSKVFSPPVPAQQGVLRQRMRGFSLITAIFLLVVLASLGAFMVTFTGLQQGTLQADVLGVRAYYAARAGTEWAMYRALDPDNTIAPGPAAFVACASASGTINTMGGSLSPFTVVVGCNETVHTEAARTLHVYEITATACNDASCPAVSPASGYVERRIVVTVAKCKDPTAPAPRYECGT